MGLHQPKCDQALRHNRVDEVPSVGGANTRDIVPARTCYQGAIQSEAKVIPTLRPRALVERARELGWHIRTDQCELDSSLQIS